MNAAEAAAAANGALLIGALGLDHIAVGQVLLSQPLVGGAILGWSLGDPAAGLLAGSFFQFLCLAELPVGASVPPDTILASLVGTAVFVGLERPAGWGDQALLGLLTAGFLPLAFAGRGCDILVRRANRVWTRLTESLLGLGHFRLAQVAAAGGILFFFLRSFLVALACLLAAAFWGGAGLERAPAAAPAFELLARCVPLLGLAALVAQRRRTGLAAALAAGLAAGFLVFQGLAR